MYEEMATISETCHPSIDVPPTFERSIVLMQQSGARTAQLVNRCLFSSQFLSVPPVLTHDLQPHPGGSRLTAGLPGVVPWRVSGGGHAGRCHPSAG